MAPGELPVERVDVLHDPATLTDWLADTTHSKRSRVLSVGRQRSASSSTLAALISGEIRTP